MAVMWPKNLPQEILRNILRNTECEVYNRLSKVLDDSFIVFYSRPWLGLTSSGAEIDGECDFVVAHKDLGFITLEVKGGAVNYEPDLEQWTTRDRWNCTHKIKNPVRQARDSKYQILEKLKQSPHWTPRKIGIYHGVILPQSIKPSKDLGADMPLGIFCFSDRFDHDLGGWIQEIFLKGQTSNDHLNPLGRDGVRALEYVLAQPFHLQLSLGHILNEDDQVIEQLTQQQFHILRAIEDIPRAAVSGAAGTGKTVLAIEESIRCAKKGMKTLLTCYNRSLSETLSFRLSKYPDIDVFSFHALCHNIATDAGIPIHENLADSRVFSEIYPEILMTGLDRLPDRRYQSIIVDEGQDFLPLWWHALDAALDRRESTFLRVFFDSNQQVYGNFSNILSDVQLTPIRLTLNLRNTRHIHTISKPFYTGYPIEAIGPDGVPVEWIEVDRIQFLKKKLESKISVMTGQNRISPDEIVILAADEAIVDRIKENGKIAGLPCHRFDINIKKGVVIETIRKFKGLESPVIIVAVTQELIINPELLYVAMTRARTKLVLIGEAVNLEFIRNHTRPQDQDRH